MCDICVRLTLNTPERRHSRRSGVIVANFAQILHVISFVDFEQADADWVRNKRSYISKITLLFQNRSTVIQ